MNKQQADLQDRLKQLDQDIRELRRQYVELAKELCGENVNDYALKTYEGKEILLSEVFGGKDDLILIHNMGKDCAYCTLWADGFNNLTPHLENRAAFAIVSPDSPQAQTEFRSSRHWQFRMISSEGSSFIEDMGFRFEDGDNSWWMPGVSIFRKSDDGKISRVAKDFFGPGDVYCSLWHFLDLLEDGGNGWQPQFKY
jgi:predicted dithiol-disulfide oxidoreductase (DUF899 family)